jgi:lactate permease
MAYDTLDWLLSLVPMLAVLALMVGFNWNTSRAGGVGWLLAIGLAVWRFGTGPDGAGYAQLKALILTVDVVIVIWAALLLYYVVDRAGALAVISDALAGLTADSLIQVLLLGWVFASFLQGVGGFGVPVAIVAPLLIGLGVPEVRAVVIPALGHGWAVTFGSLAASFIMLVNATGLPGEKLAPAAAVMLGILCYMTGLMCAHALDGWRGVRRSVPYVFVVSTAMSAGQFLAATNGLWTIGAISGGLFGLVASVGWIRFSGPRKLRAAGDRSGNPSLLGEEPALSQSPLASLVAEGSPAGEVKSRPSIRLAFSSYVILIVLALTLRGIVPVKEFLGQWAVAIDIPATTTDRDWTVARAEDAGFGIPAHPGIVILYSCTIAYLLYRRAGLYAPGAAQDILQQSGRRAFKAGIGVFMMVGVAATMERAGMIEVLADGMSKAVPGDLYAFIAPAIGALGAFVTGSNVNSNAVFSMLQLNTARLLGLSIYAILGAQTAAAAVISVMSPAKVTVGCSTVGANEGVVMRLLLGYGAVVILTVGLMAWIGVSLL